MEDQAKNTPKKKKKPFVSMDIAKVPLDPQQVVLTCCEQPERSPQDGFGWQYAGGAAFCGGGDLLEGLAS